PPSLRGQYRLQGAAGGVWAGVLRHVAGRRSARDDRICRPSLVHRRAVPSRVEVAPVRAASAVRQLHRGSGRAEPAGVSGRRLDHLVLPVAGLDAARTRLERLGFTVAPQGTHPFGTINACVYFADGTFIEPLAVGDAEIVKAALAAGNSFVLGDARFRAAVGEEGLSGLVLATGAADADHVAFVEKGISGGPMVEFSRPSLDKDGKADIASFRLAFAAPSGGADAFFFNCERRKVPAIDRSALER